METAERYVACNDRVEEIQFNVEAQQLGTPEAHESLLMGMSDILLHKLQRLIAERGFPMKSLTCLSLQSVEPFPLPFRYINQYSCLCPLSMDGVTDKTLLAMLDWISQKWMMAQIVNPFIEFRLVLTLIDYDLE